jgi:hypothetical protein
LQANYPSDSNDGSGFVKSSIPNCPTMPPTG